MRMRMGEKVAVHAGGGAAGRTGSLELGCLQKPSPPEPICNDRLVATSPWDRPAKPVWEVVVGRATTGRSLSWPLCPPAPVGGGWWCIPPWPSPSLQPATLGCPGCHVWLLKAVLGVVSCQRGVRVVCETGGCSQLQAEQGHGSYSRAALPSLPEAPEAMPPKPARSSGSQASLPWLLTLAKREHSSCLRETGLGVGGGDGGNLVTNAPCNTVNILLTVPNLENNPQPSNNNNKDNNARMRTFQMPLSSLVEFYAHRK